MMRPPASVTTHCHIHLHATSAHHRCSAQPGVNDDTHRCHTCINCVHLLPGSQACSREYSGIAASKIGRDCRQREGGIARRRGEAAQRGCCRMRCADMCTYLVWMCWQGHGEEHEVNGECP